MVFTKARRWGRLRTSQWHILHSIRADRDGNEFMLTVDGEYLPTERVKWQWPRSLDAKPESTGARVFEGTKPKGPICSRCYSFASLEEGTVEVG